MVVGGARLTPQYISRVANADPKDTPPPSVHFNSDRIRELGWDNVYTTREAIRRSLESLLRDFRSGKIL